MNDYEVTLAMPVYNVEKYVERALMSALCQTFKSIEFLIIDDKGSDGSMGVVARIKKNHPRGEHIRIIEHEKNIGTGGTKNTAIKEAKGEFLYFMDSDDTIIPETIEILYHKQKQTQADVVMASCQEVENDTIKKKYVYPDLDVTGNLAICKWMEDTGFLYEMPTWNKLYRLSVLRDNNITCIPHHRNEDTVFTFKTLFCVKNLSTISTITYNYYYNDSSTVHQTVSDFYYNQYMEIFDERKNVLLHQGSHITNTLKYFFLEPFFESFIPKVLNSSFPKEKKYLFMRKMADIKFLDFESSKLSPADYCFLYSMIINNNFNGLMLYYKIRPYLKRIKLL